MGNVGNTWATLWLPPHFRQAWATSSIVLRMYAGASQPRGLVPGEFRYGEEKSSVGFSCVVATAVALALTLNVLQFLLDSTPRTNLTVAGLLASFRTALPPESIGLLALSGIVAVFGLLIDRL